MLGPRLSDNIRFCIQLDLRWSLGTTRTAPLDTGCGRTVSVSSSEVCFLCSRQFPIDKRMRLYLIWPVKLHDGTPLQVVVKGEVTESSETGTTVKTEHHEFRTMASKAIHPLEIHGDQPIIQDEASSERAGS